MDEHECAEKLSGRQIQAKINAGNRLEEYLQGIRVMKAYNLLGDRFVRLRDALRNCAVPVSVRKPCWGLSCC